MSSRAQFVTQLTDFLTSTTSKFLRHDVFVFEAASHIFETA
jgi:hypothetical protein